MKILNKLQALPEKEKKIILWSIVIIMVVILFIFYIQNIKKKLEGIRGEDIEQELQIPKLREQLKDLWKFNFPQD